MKKWHHQKGMTAIGWMLVLGIIAFFTLITLRMVPLYLEFGKVASTLESLKEQPNVTQMTKSEIVQIVSKRFNVNDVKNVDPKQIKVSKNKGVLKVGISYERREHLAGNVDIVATFEKQIEVVAN